MVSYPTECLPVWKHCLYKPPKPFKQNFHCSCKATLSIELKPLPLEELKIRGQVRSRRNTGAKPVRATLQPDKNSPCQNLLSLQSSFTTRFNYCDSLQLRVRTTKQGKYSHKWSEEGKTKAFMPSRARWRKVVHNNKVKSCSLVDSYVQIDACPR